MVTDVTYLCTIMNQQQGIMNDSKSTALITRDLLGGGAGGGCDLDSSTELDLDLHVPSGYEKRLDLKSGKVYLQRCKSPNTSSSSSDQNQSDQTVSKLQDLNFPPSSKKALNLFDDSSLDLNLVNLSASPPAYRSVCTLDKVKFALERAERETIKKRSVSIPKSCSSPTSNSSSSMKETLIIDDDDENDERSSQAYAAGCPSCLLYVLISRSNPRCPRCNMTVPSPTAMKKPRIDLNISI